METALIVGGFTVLFFVLPHALTGDDNTRFADIDRLLRDGIDSDSRYSLAMPLASAPFLLLGRAVQAPEWWAARFNVIVVAIGIVVAWRLARERFSPSLLRKVVLLLLFASLLTNRLRDYNAEVFTATLVAVGIVALITGHPLAGWAAIVLGVVNTPAALVPLGLLAAAETIRTRRLRWLTAPAVAAGLIMTEAWIRRGGPLTTGYEHNHGFATMLPYSGKSGFSLPFVIGLVSILFSFGRGLVFYIPGLLLWASAWTRRLLEVSRWALTLMLLFVAGLVVVYAKWWAWYGGLSWGPRFFVFAAVPASLFLAVRLEHRGESLGHDAVTLAVLFLSAWVSLAGATSDLVFLGGFCGQHNYAFESFCWYSPELSSLWWPFLRHPALTWERGLVATYVVIVCLAQPVLESEAARLRSRPNASPTSS